MTTGKPIRLRDFIEDEDGWLYAVSAYDNDERVGCILRYIPHPEGERSDQAGRRYRKLDFDEAYALISEKKPDYCRLIHRVPRDEIRKVLKPEDEIRQAMSRDPRVRNIAGLLMLRKGEYGCTGSRLCGLEDASSDIDLVIYGEHWQEASRRLEELVGEGLLEEITDAMWLRIYEKRRPSIPFQEFILHEKRKWNRGQIGGTYFDLLYTRPYTDIETRAAVKGKVLGRQFIRAEVINADRAFDHPAVYTVRHEEISRVISFTHTYAGQARAGEVLEASGVCEENNGERWLVVGTSREAPGEYIRSVSLLEKHR
ncbi:MAG: DNA polymerase subunit beta [Methanoregulaceae archaeon]|nr:DNA polymerase subunit beta [Methanoregulaceae archaeon]